ncbi:MAG: PAS domain S-box protein [Gemmatimonadota bacterium]|jgi:two-component system cell cycle sensor histidine kinase/response regulator CckA
MTGPTRRGADLSAFAEAILNATADGIVVIDADGVVLACNPAAEQLLGRPAGELVGAQFWGPITGGAAVRSSEIQVLRPGGEARTVELRSAETTWAGRAVSIIAMRDSTRRREAEEQRQRLLSIIEATPELVSLAEADGRLLYLNQAGREMLGLAPDDDLAKHNVRDFTPLWAAQQMEKEAIPKATEEGSWSGEGAILDADGRQIPIWQVILGHRSADGAVRYMSTMARDLTEQKAAAAALRKRVKEIRTLYGVQRELARSEEPLERRVRALVGLLPGGWLHPDVTEVRIVYQGESFATPEFRETPWMLSAELRLDDDVVGRLDVALLEQRPDQEEGEGPFLKEERELLDSVATAVNEALEHERLQKELVQAQKIETIGRLAGGVAHDFNNLLTVIRGTAQMVIEDLPEGGSIRGDVEQILAASARGATLTRQLLAFSRKEILKEELFYVRDAVDELEPLLRRLIPERIELHFEAGSERGPVKADRGKLMQAIMNLAVNARDAVEGDGRISFGVDTYEIAQREAAEEIPWLVAPGCYVRVSVKDTGTGMSDEVLSRIFEPFFTTKSEGKGTGLGLSVVYGFVKQSGGHIFVDTEPGRGTVFHLLLPVAEAGAVPGEHGPGRQAGMAGQAGATVLLVEDNPSVRGVTVRMLEREGCAVIEASSGREALDLARENGDRIDIAISDMVMPEMGGAELAERLRELLPDLKIVLMSGYSADELGARTLDPDMSFLEKPFDREDLARVLAENLPPRPR